jgi:divalent metal cation (Fe/Co/Zn/Cd) transporter
VFARSPPLIAFDPTAVEGAYCSQQRTSNAILNAVLVALLLIGGVTFAYIIPRWVHDWGELVSNITALAAIAVLLAAVAYEAVVTYLLWLSLRHQGRALIKLEILANGFSQMSADGCRRD